MEKVTVRVRVPVVEREGSGVIKNRKKISESRV